ncbi:MAG: YciI family protein [Micromonosporaceae bacterium]
MRYLFLLYGDEQAEAALTDEQREEIITAHGTFTESLHAESREVSGAGMEPTSTATLVRRSADGAEEITDGPYAETKEQIGGLYLVECADMDDALAVANRVPYSPGLRIEVRPAPY